MKSKLYIPTKRKARERLEEMQKKKREREFLRSYVECWERLEGMFSVSVVLFSVYFYFYDATQRVGRAQ